MLPWVEEAGAFLRSDVLTGSRRCCVRHNILVEVKELHRHLLHRRYGLDSGPLTADFRLANLLALAEAAVTILCLLRLLYPIAG